MGCGVGDVFYNNMEKVIPEWKWEYAAWSCHGDPSTQQSYQCVSHCIHIEELLWTHVLVPLISTF